MVVLRKIEFVLYLISPCITDLVITQNLIDLFDEKLELTMVPLWWMLLYFSLTFRWKLCKHWVIDLYDSLVAKRYQGLQAILIKGFVENLWADWNGPISSSLGYLQQPAFRRNEDDVENQGRTTPGRGTPGRITPSSAVSRKSATINKRPISPVITSQVRPATTLYPCQQCSFLHFEESGVFDVKSFILHQLQENP